MGTWLIACEGAREIPSFPGYLVTPSGFVFGCRTNVGFRAEYRQLRPSPDAKGYAGLTICGHGGIRRKVRVHRLVAEVFIPNPRWKPCVRHLDGNCANNAVSNLAWGTHLENEADKRGHGTYDLRRNGKLTPEARKAIVEMASDGWSQVALAALYGVSRSTITRLLNGATWA